MDTGGDLCKMMEELSVGRSFYCVYIDWKVMLAVIVKSWHSWMRRSACSAIGSLYQQEMIML